MLEVKSVSKTYGKRDAKTKALDRVSFNVPDGAVVAIIGKSGSGKSTLMHAMSGLDSIDGGSIIFQSHDIHKMSRKESERFRAKELGFIFQSFFIEPNVNVYQNVQLPLEIGRVRRRQRKTLVNAALDSVGLLDKSGARARDLSGGQKQRLAIARAIVHKPRLIFADEPTGNLDSVTGDKIIKLLFGLNKSLGATLIIVTHDHELADKCQVKIELVDGKLRSLTRGKMSLPAKKTSLSKEATEMERLGTKMSAKTSKKPQRKVVS
jgi:putative ABC transport system ATP-binding protein